MSLRIENLSHHNKFEMSVWLQSHYFPPFEDNWLFFCSEITAYLSLLFSAEDTDNAEASTCGKILIFLSWVLVFLTMPISLLVCFKVSDLWLLNTCSSFPTDMCCTIAFISNILLMVRRTKSTAEHNNLHIEHAPEETFASEAEAECIAGLNVFYSCY